MKNSEKNTYVKRKIVEATIRLLKVKDLKDISVIEICNLAQVSRNSFYRNYLEKEDILQEHILWLFKQWIEEYIAQKSYSDDELMVHMFKHLHENADFYTDLHRRKLIYLLKGVIKESIGPKPEQTNIAAYTAAFIYSGIFGWIEEWILRGMQESSEEMAALLKQRNMS